MHVDAEEGQGDTQLVRRTLAGIEIPPDAPTLAKARLPSRRTVATPLALRHGITT
ncbi:hypothetical protein [Kitasatospora sp. NPDC001683]